VSKTVEVIKVSIADLNVVHAPKLLRTSGLGSCVGIVIYDLALRLAGMAHIMLPDSSQSRQDPINRCKYADTAITDLISMIQSNGGNKYTLKAKIAGGAQMFHFASGSDALRIGPRNTEAVLDNLAFHRIPVVAKDTGGSMGRTIEFHPETGKLKVRTVNKEEFYL
jgi:chemotaxis protein CheD